jgi:hypothetical protein
MQISQKINDSIRYGDTAQKSETNSRTDTETKLRLATRTDSADAEFRLYSPTLNSAGTTPVQRKSI